MWGNRVRRCSENLLFYRTRVQSCLFLPLTAVIVDLIDLTLGDEDANSKVDVATDVEVDLCESTQLSVQVSCVCEMDNDWQVSQY